MSFGGGGGSKQKYTVGYRYRMGIHMVVCRGPIDSLNKIIVGERSAWAGSATANTTLSINAPGLFGGDAREGGVQGDVELLFGGATQGRSSYLARFQGDFCPAYRGKFSAVFKRFMWSAMNPYFKAPWFEVTRIFADWENNTVWQPAYAKIGDLDMNPAHMIYQCLTKTEWGMGYSDSDIDQASFLAAAQTLHAEGFGLSYHWVDSGPIEDFIKLIINHINGALSLNLSTGKFTLKLIRGDYDVATLFELNESNVLDFKSFQRSVVGEGANEVIVEYTNREENKVTIAVQNPAKIMAQEAIISTTVSYPGIRSSELAVRVGMRDLKVLSTDLAQAVLIVNRAIWDKTKGDVVKLKWTEHGLDGVPFRIMDISKGKIDDGKITVTLLEDVFAMPGTGYVTVPQSKWVDTVVPPIAVDASKAVEAPYWEVVKNISQANQAFLQPGYGFGMFMAGRGSVQNPYSFALSASANDITYYDVGSGHITPTGVLANAINKLTTSIVLSAGYDLASVTLSSDEGYAYIENECVAITAINPETGECTIGRGILDTVPAHHSAGVKVFFVTYGCVRDTNDRIEGETVYYRPRPVTGIGVLDLEDAETESVVFAGRAERPYPPAGLTVNGLSYPATIGGPNITLGWKHRDRVAQTVSFADQTVGNIGPEPGVQYLIRVFAGEVLLRSYLVSGSTTQWTYPTNDDIADGRKPSLKITVSSIRNGKQSLQSLEHTVVRLVVTGGTYVEGPPATPILTATPGTFAIALSWVFGNAATNIEKTELWVSPTPIFEDGQTVWYETYPSQDYLLELSEVGAHRWCWARVHDTGGQLSAWSPVAYARAGFSSGVKTVDELPETPAPGDEVVRLSSNGRLYVWDGALGEWITGVKAGDIIGEINGNQIVAGSITGELIAEETLTGEHLTPSSVTTDKLAANSVIAEKIVAEAVTTLKLATNAVTADKLAANSVTAEKLVANSVTAEKMSVAMLSAISANMGSITAGSMSIGGKFIVNTDGSVTIRSAVTGARLEIYSNVIKVYDANNVLRVKLGDLSA